MCKSVSRLRVLPLPQKAYVEALCVHFLCEYSCITLYDLNVRVSVTFSAVNIMSLSLNGVFHFLSISVLCQTQEEEEFPVWDCHLCGGDS